MSERNSMRKIREVLRLKFECERSNRQIALSCRIGAGTVSEYLQRAKASSISAGTNARVERNTQLRDSALRLVRRSRCALRQAGRARSRRRATQPAPPQNSAPGRPHGDGIAEVVPRAARVPGDGGRELDGLLSPAQSRRSCRPVGGQRSSPRQVPQPQRGAEQGKPALTELTSLFPGF